MGVWISAVVRDPKVLALKDGEYRVLMTAVVEWANDEGEFFPSQSTWARKAGKPLSSFKRALAGLEEKGIVEHQRQLRAGGPLRGEMSCHYRRSMKSSVSWLMSGSASVRT